MELWQLFFSFLKISTFGFGGGTAMVPLIQIEVVDVQGWLSREEFIDAFAFGNTLPGPIATKLAGYVGYQIAGTPGAVAGLLGLTLPPVIAIIALGSVYTRHRNSPWLAGFLRGARPVVVALLALVVYDFIPNALGRPATWLNNWALWLIATAAFVLSVRWGAHPALLIVVGGLSGMLFLR